MMNTERLYKKNNYQTLSWTLSKSFTQYRIIFSGSVATLHSPEFSRLRMRMLLSLIECHGTVLDCVMWYDDFSYKMCVLCASKAIPSVFSSVIHKMIPSAIIEEIPSYKMARTMEQQMESPESFSLPPKVASSLKTSREVLISLLLEYRGLLCSSFASSCNTKDVGSNKNSSCKDLEVPFVFFLKRDELVGLPEFMVDNISLDENSFSLKTKSEYSEKTIKEIKPQVLKKINIAQMQCIEKRQNGFYRTFSKDLHFTLLVPTLLEKSL